MHLVVEKRVLAPKLNTPEMFLSLVYHLYNGSHKKIDKNCRNTHLKCTCFGMLVEKVTLIVVCLDTYLHRETVGEGLATRDYAQVCS